jgi:hypothetical protein
MAHMLAKQSFYLGAIVAGLRDCRFCTDRHLARALARDIGQSCVQKPQSGWR